MQSNQNTTEANLKLLTELFPDLNLFPLKGKYVLVKKFKNTSYYYGETRRRRYGSPTGFRTNFTNAGLAKVFDSYQEAKTKVDYLNSSRKKNKLTIDNAENHFLISYRVRDGYSSFLTLETNWISVQDFKNKKPTLVHNFIPKILESSKNELQMKLERVAKLQSDISRLEKLEKLDFNKLLNSIKTDFQKNVEILYSRNN